MADYPSYPRQSVTWPAAADQPVVHFLKIHTMTCTVCGIAPTQAGLRYTEEIQRVTCRGCLGMTDPPPVDNLAALERWLDA